MKPAEARARIDRLRATNPAAADLATLCALAMRAEPTLVRRLRVLLPGADVTAESDLWASDVLSGATVTGIALAPEVATQLRADLRSARWDGVRVKAFEAVAAEHAREHWSQRLEEQLHRMEVVGEPDDRRADLLLAALRALVEAGDEVPAGGRRRGRLSRAAATGDPGIPPLTPQQAGIARWLLGALARLPRADRESETGRVVRLGADLHLRGHAPDSDTPDVASAGWLPWLLAQASGPPVSVPVGFAAGVLDVGGPGPLVELPRTDPLVLDVDWHDGRRAQHRRLRFAPGERTTVRVCAERVELTALDGSGVTLRTVRRPSAGLDFSAERARRRPCLARGAEIEQVLSTSSGWVEITGPRGSGKSVLACAVADRAERQGAVVAQHFFGVEPRWDTTDEVMASLGAQLGSRRPFPFAAIPDSAARLAAELTDAVARNTSDAAHPVVVLLDALPGPPDALSPRPFRRDDERTFIEVLAGNLPPGVLVVATVDDAARQGVDLDVIVDLGGQGDAVCTAILDRHIDGLRAAFGTDLDVDPGPGVPHRDELVALADGNPGRLSGIVDWLLDRPAGSARLDDIPYLLTTREREIGRRLEEHTGLPWDIVEPVAVALPGYTVDDVRRLAGPGGDEVVRGTLSAVRGTLAVAAEMGLLTLDGPVTVGTTTVTPHPGLAAWLADRDGPDQMSESHFRHLLPLLGHAAQIIGPPSTARVEDAGGYAIASAIHHAIHDVRHRVSDKFRVCLSGAWLHRRVVDGGVAALLADLRAIAMEAEAAPAEAWEFVNDPEPDWPSALLRAAETVASTEPERFVELLVNALRHHGHDDIAVELLRTAWPTPLAVREVVPLGVAPDRWTASVTAATVLEDGRIIAVGPDGVSTVGSTEAPRQPPSGTFVVEAAGTLYIAVDTTVRRIPTTTPPPPTSPAERFPSVAPTRMTLSSRVTVLAAVGDTLAAGTMHGIVAVTGTAQGRPLILLIGHGAEVLTLLIASDDVLVSGSADGTARSWSPVTGEQLAVVDHRGPVRHITATAPGVVVTADDAGRLAWWVPRTGEVLRRVDGHDGPVTGLFHDDSLGAVVSAGLDGRIRRWDSEPSDGDEVVALTEPVQVLARTPAGFVTWHGSGELRWWYDITGEQTGAAQPNGIVAPVVGLYPRGNDAVVVVHAGGAVTVSPQPEPAYLGLLAVGADGVATAGTADGLVRTTGRPLPVTPLPNAPVSGVAVAEGGWAVADNAGNLTWLSDDGTAVDSHRATLLAGDTGGHVAAYHADQVVLMSDPPQRTGADLVVPATDVTALAVGGPDTVVIGDRASRLRHVRGSAAVYRTAEIDVGAAVTALVVSGRHVIAGTADGRVLRWNPGEPATTELGRHEGPVTGLAAIAEPPLVLCHTGFARADGAAHAADSFLAALRDAGLEVRANFENIITPRRRILQSCEDAARASDALLVVLARPVREVTAGNLEIEAMIHGTSAGQPVIPVLANPDVPLPAVLRDRQAVSISDVDAVLDALRGTGSGPVVSASADGTARVWDVRLGAESARYAAPGPVHAIAAVPGTRAVIARTGPDDLTRLEVTAPGPLESPVIGERTATTEPATSGVRLRARTVCELRAVEVSRAGTDLPATALQLTGLDARFPIDLRPDGRLTRPRRLYPDDGGGVEVRAAVEEPASLFVAVAVPGRTDELTFPIRVPEEPA